jgi:hypothetical protein
MSTAALSGGDAMPNTTTRATCRHCFHPAHRADCGVDDCGCVRFEPIDKAARAERKRLWVAEVSFLLRTGWTRRTEVRVRAQGQAGAAAKAVREAKRLLVKPRARVAQVRLTIIPVARPRR